MRVRKIASTTTALALVAGGALWSAAPASAATASALASAIFATPSVVRSATLSTVNAATTAVRSNNLAGFPSRAGGSYAVLSTGAASALSGTTQSTSPNTPYVMTPVRGGAHDVTTLEVTIDVPTGMNCLLGVTFRFLTDEFPEEVGKEFNDAFIAEVGASTWSVNPDSSINAPNNFAFDTMGRPISLNAGLFASSTAAREAARTVFDGATPQLTAQVPLTGGSQEKLYFSIFDMGDAAVDSAVLIDNLRIGTVDDPATQCRKGATTNPTEIRVSATAPTQVDDFGTADDTYTIPATDGVTYRVGGTTVAAGTYPGRGTVVVTATAKTGYVLSGPTQFALVFTDLREATATEPTWTDTWGTANDTFRIPSVPGVRYAVGGIARAAGTYPAVGTVTVDATATTGYGLSGPTQFTHTFTDIRQVTAAEPTWHDTYGTAEDTFTIPSVTGVQYAVDGTPLAAGAYPATNTVTIDATATAGYVLVGPSQFTRTFTDIRQVTAAEPTWHDTYGTAEDTFTIPSVTGVQYAADGAPLAAGAYPATGTVTIDATPTAGYVLVGPSQFTRTFTDIRQVSATAPTHVDTYGTAEDTYTIPSVTGVEYAVDGAPVPAGSHPGSGTVVVTATATPGYELTGPSQFTFTFTDVVLATAVEPTWYDTYGTADDTVTIPSVRGVEYAVDGVPVAAGAHAASGTVAVTATATAGYELTGPSQFSYAFTDIRLVTAVEPTWADTYGTDDDTYTIPSVTGVQYAVDGDPVAPGTYPASGTVVVTATATAGYELTGPSQFSYAFTDIRLVTAVEPTWADTYGTDDDTYTIPSVTGVQYAVDGDPVAPGTYPASGTVVVTATATTGHELTGASEFTRTFTDIRLVTAAEPTSVDTYGTDDDTYTIPSVTGVQYAVDGSPVAAGTYPATGTVVVTATATTGHELTGPSQFTLVFTDITLTTVVAPTWHDVDGTADDTFTLPVVDGVVWTRDGDVLTPGTHPGSGTVTLVATAALGHELTGTTTHSFTFTDLEHVTVPAPTATDHPGTARDVVTVPAATGVTYLLDGVPLAPGDHALTGDVVLEAVASAPRYVLVGTTTFPLHLSGTDVPGAPTITQVTAGSRSVNIEFAAPDATGGTPVTGYEYSLDGGTTWLPVDRSPLVVTGLVNGTQYRVAVRADNALGAGDASTVVTVTPVPAPLEVPDADGTLGLPALTPDEAAVWFDGVREPSTVTTEAGTRTVTADGVRVTLTGLDAAGRPGAAAGRVVIAPDGSVTVTGSGFAPGELVDVWLFSTPVLLGTVRVGDDGTFAARFALPAGVAAGQHTLQLNGTTADGALASVASGVLVEAAPVAAPVPAPASGAPAGAALAVTGSSVTAGTLLATALLVGGGLAVAFAARRRRSA
ncbi:fibronectin type III domain-containing protein [Cellulomonas dongxiuzhuiae]|uniref:Fibronectin type III domain-containing protein n=1 Tax=Cellulomonas dongxiuzhuiae TaxID=2819979 RepID=A0ABX8GIX9_9CELL|nr:fibronectin type III domain-containing protein [Cellulomonas dongxiuzhuiae]MBO3094827.1 fibronectin type III domain-containing protein [Cellulomonas dongxiuzhuiae]QWC15860.1 fibronectin type III domain-containing protein [Cellulomonas dongxiuzhuiae]